MAARPSHLAITLALAMFCEPATAQLDQGQDNAPPVGQPLAMQETGGNSPAATGLAADRQSQQKDEIVVTGTRLRGAGVSVGTAIISIDRSEIERSGHATTQQFMQSLPQNFGGGASEDTRRGAEAISTGKRQASGVNLRGLGNVATLVLLNGRRMIGGSDNGDIPDISLIPTGAIERIEILPDGASSVYGSDAVAGVVNFILRSDYEGAETTVRYGGQTSSALDEYQASQTFGFGWEGGSLLLTGEFYHRGSLSTAERRFTRSSDLRPLGGSDHGSIYSVPGNVLNSSGFQPVFAIPPGQDGRTLSPADLLPVSQANIFNTQAGADLLPRQRRYSLFSRVSQDLADNFEAYIEAFFSRRKTRYKSSSPTYLAIVGPENPFYVDAFGNGRPVYVSYNFDNDYGPLTSEATQKSLQGTTGAEWQISDRLRASGYFTYARNVGDTTFLARPDFAAAAAALRDPNPETALNVFGNGTGNNPETIARIFSDTDYLDKIRSDFWTANLFFDGRLIDLPAGPLRIGFGGEMRRERLRSIIEADRKRFRRRVAAAFGELFIPIVASSNRLSGVESLDVSLSLRTERYEDAQLEPQYMPRRAAETTNPKLGVNWVVVSGLSLQGSYGTAFRAPSLPQQVERKVLAFGSINDPLSPTGRNTALYISGTRPDLENEKATTWTVGATLEPRIAPGLRLRATYYNIKFKNRIAGGVLPSEMLADEEGFDDFIIRNPGVADLQNACQNGRVSGIPPAACTTPGVAGLIFDLRTANRSVQKTSGIDLVGTYTIDAGELGALTLSANANYILNFKESPTSAAPSKSVLNLFANPVDLRVRAGLGWATPDGLTASAFVNYMDSYIDHISNPRRKISSHTTVDISLSYNTEDTVKSALLRNVSLTLSVVNLLANDPPFVDTLGGYDAENADPLGRMISLTVRKRF